MSLDSFPDKVKKKSNFPRDYILFLFRMNLNSSFFWMYNFYFFHILELCSLHHFVLKCCFTHLLWLFDTGIQRYFRRFLLFEKKKTFSRSLTSIINVWKHWHCFYLNLKCFGIYLNSYISGGNVFLHISNMHATLNK